ncbi:MAG: integrase [Candidatus Heimdallarchaeota archaeon]
MNSLSALVKYLGLYEEFKRLVKEHGLTWGGRSADDIVIERLTKVKNPNEVFEWIKRVKKERPDLTVFMDFIAVTGLRLVEALNSYNLTIALSRKGKLGEYYNAELETLEHYKFKDIFLRKQKKAFASFVPKELVERITVCERLPSTDGIIKRVRKSGLPSRFSDVREAHASFMTSYLRQSEIDFLHGRVTANVFMSNYFNPYADSRLEAESFQGNS